MKIQPSKAAAFLRKPDAAIRAVLLFGPDSGLARERARELARTIVSDLSDPFRVVDLPATGLADDPARLSDEAAAMSLTGGRRVVMVRGAGDRQAALFKSFLEHPVGDALIIVEAGELTARSSLRVAFEEAEVAAAIGCYADDANSLEDLIERIFGAAKIDIEPDALEYLKENLGLDRGITRGELEKLRLYKGADRSPITLAEASACVGDSAGADLDDAAYAAAGGDVGALEEALARCAVAGESPIAILRAAQRHMQRLHIAQGQRDRGLDPGQIAKSFRLHFRREPAFRQQLTLWDRARAMQALDILTEAEIDCKSTGMPDTALCHRALLRIATAAQARRRN